jgi:hypothetical protein
MSAMDSEDREAFEKFLLAEYEHIANAHFNAVATISEFFKHYVTMIGLPLAAIPIVIKIFPEPAAAIAKLKGYELVLITASVFVAVIGLCMMLYIVSLQNVSLLYARTVNGIRHYFYNIAALEPGVERSFRKLPRSIEKPRYFRESFAPVIIAFGLLDGGYPALAWFLIAIERHSAFNTCAMIAIIGILGASVAIHLISYWVYTHFELT